MHGGLTDHEIEARLRLASSAQWDVVDAAVAEFERSNPHGHWAGGETGSDGSITMPFAVVDESVRALTSAVRGLGASEPFDWIAWDGLNRFPIAVGLDDVPVAESIRFLTALSRAERFNEGMILTYAENGALLRVINRIRRWGTERNAG